MSTKLKLSLITFLICLNPLLALAQSQRTLLPQSSETSNVGCTIIMKKFQDIYNFGINNEEIDTTELNSSTSGSIARFFLSLDIYNQTNNSELTQDDILGCSIITGRIKMAYLNVFIFYALSWLSIASGVVAMIFIIIGGYKYIVGGLMENQDEGKKTIVNALIGLLVSTGAWIIVSIIQSFISR